MLRQKTGFVLAVWCLLGTRQCSLLVDAILIFHPLEPFVPCADGSPAGIYVEQDPKVDLSTSKDHVIVFDSGGACTSPEECIDVFDVEPSKFTSILLPPDIEGHTVLSQDASTNPMHSHTKWFVPYCSQDLFLGDVNKGKIGEFTHAGSAIFDGALSYWKDQVLTALTNTRTPDTDSTPRLNSLVVVGISAGAIGALNKIDQIREAVTQVGAQHLRLLLDAPTVLSDLPYPDKDFQAMMNTYVDLTEHPLCDPLHRFSRLYSEVSTLPCCLSTNCMLRHDPRLTILYETSTGDSTEELLLLDSAYDAFALLPGTLHDGDDDDEEENAGGDSTRQDADDLWSMVEQAGSRKTRGFETTASTKARMQNQQLPPAVSEPRVKWIFMSCLSHTLLVPSVEILHTGCQYGNYEDEDYDYVCSRDGAGIVLTPSFIDMTLRVWVTTETWELVEFQGQSIREIVANFVSVQPPRPEQTNITEEAILLQLQQCSGPNCLEQNLDDSVLPSCQTFIVIDDTFVPVPRPFQITWLMILIVVVLSQLFRCGRSRGLKGDSDDLGVSAGSTTASGNTLTSSGTSAGEVSVHGINVTTNDGTALLHNVSVSLPAGTVNALCGRSGSGKTTLLRALSQLEQRGVTVTIREGGVELEEIPKAYLRQEDSVAFGDLVPAEYLRLSAEIYAAPNDKFLELYKLTMRLFDRGQAKSAERDEDSGWTSAASLWASSNNLQEKVNPFMHAKIKDLSGGQRRILAIASTLLLGPQLILADEPLSGLDMVSSLEVMEALHTMAETRNCTVLMTVHQPSDAILAFYNRLIVVGNGEIVYDRGVKDTGVRASSRLLNTHLAESYCTVGEERPRGLSAILSRHRHNSRGSCGESEEHESEDFCCSCQRPALRRGSVSSGQTPNDEPEQVPPCRWSASRRDVAFGEASESVDPVARHAVSVASSDSHLCSPELDKSEKSPGRLDVVGERSRYRSWCLPTFIQQARPVAQRLHCQYGWDWISIVTAACAISAVALILNFETFFVSQVVLMTLGFIGIPVLLFPHKIYEHSDMWLAHRLELDDRRISLVAFQLATTVFTFSMPILSLFVAQTLAYAILQWSFRTYLVTVIFSAVHLCIALQTGRVLAVAFRGNNSNVTRTITIIFFLSFAFSSALVASQKLPVGLRWMFWFSFDFWAMSGAVMNQFDDENYSNDDCFDFVTCLLSDGSFIVRILGFSPMSNSYLALGVLTLWLAVMILLEYATLRYHCFGVRLFVNPFERKSSRKSAESASNEEGDDQARQPAIQLGTEHTVDDSLSEASC